MLDIIEVRSISQIKKVEQLANKIWNEYYRPIIGKKQVDYMLSRFQSVDAIQRQIEQGYRYFLSLYEGQYVGYFAIESDQDKGSMFISKLYVDKDFRGQGIGRGSISYIEKVCENSGLNIVWLTVNKDNKNSIAAYKKMGFAIAECIVQDIGDGFVMDDYKMEKKLS